MDITRSRVPEGWHGVDPDMAETYQRVFAEGEGRQVLEDLLRQFGFYQQSFTREGPAESAFNEGQRSAALWLWHNMHFQRPVRKKDDPESE